MIKPGAPFRRRPFFPVTEASGMPFGSTVTMTRLVHTHIGRV
jgi:hypothetical protein